MFSLSKSRTVHNVSRADDKESMSRKHRFRRLSATVGVALVLTAVVVPGVYAAPDSTVAPEPATKRSAPHAGELISAAAISLRSYPGTKAWRITYRSTTTTGTSDVVSGAVIAPDTATAGTPIVGYAPGTLGLGDQCAQSRNLDVSLYSGGPSEKELIQNYTTAGYAVAITDYEGLGTPGGHPYMVGRSEGHALLDVVRAAQHLPGSNLSPAASVALVGYSQGGLATGWAAQLAPTYAPEVDLVGVSSGGPPADGNINVRYLDGKKYAGLVFATVYGLDVAYPELHLERYLNAKGRAAFADIADDCVAELDGPKWQNQKLSEFTTQDILARPDWRAALNKESLGRRTPTVPVLLYNSRADEIVPYAPTAKLAGTWSRHGTDVTFYSPKTGGHGSTGLSMAPVVTGWVAARFIGLPTTPTRGGR